MSTRPTPMETAVDTTQLLLEARAGQPEANERLFVHLYGDLRAVAHARVRASGSHATLGTTGLVHEAYVRLVDRGQVQPEDRAHFMALAARAMRYVLLDRARARQREKRGGPQPDFPLDADALAADERAADVLALDEALERLRARSPRLAEVVEYRFYGGFSYAEVAELTGRSIATIERDWARARLWLYDAMTEEPIEPTT